MSTIHIKHQHILRHDETRKRVEQIAKYLSKKYKVNYSWAGNQLHSRHKGSSVSVFIEDGCIEMKIKLCLLFSPLKGRIENAIHKNLHSVIGDSTGAPARMMLFESV